MQPNQLWLTPAQAAPFLGYETLDALWRDLREGRFPWSYRRIGKRYKICARSIGAIPEGKGDNSEGGGNESTTTNQ